MQKLGTYPFYLYNRIFHTTPSSKTTVLASGLCFRNISWVIGGNTNFVMKKIFEKFKWFWSLKIIVNEVTITQYMYSLCSQMWPTLVIDLIALLHLNYIENHEIAFDENFLRMRKIQVTKLYFLFTDVSWTASQNSCQCYSWKI